MMAGMSTWAVRGGVMPMYFLVCVLLPLFLFFILLILFYVYILDFIRAENNAADRLFQSPYHGYDGPLHVQDAQYPYDVSVAAVRGAYEALGVPLNPDFNGTQHTPHKLHHIHNTLTHITGVTQEGANLYQLTQKNSRR